MKNIALVSMLSICLVITGCTSTRTVPLSQAPDAPAPKVAIDDRVIVTMKSGAVWNLRVEAVDAQTLTGRNVEGPRRGSSSQLALADIQQIQVRKVLWGPTVLVIAGAVLVGLVVGAVHCFSDGRTYCARED